MHQSSFRQNINRVQLCCNSAKKYYESPKLDWTYVLWSLTLCINSNSFPITLSLNGNQMPRSICLCFDERKTGACILDLAIANSFFHRSLYKISISRIFQLSWKISQTGLEGSCKLFSSLCIRHNCLYHKLSHFNKPKTGLDLCFMVPDIMHKFK
jgi:hypothetical protein